MQVAIYGAGEEFRTRSLAALRLVVAEGHLLGQGQSSVRGYVWRDKFYGTVVTPWDTLHIEPIVHLGPVGLVRPPGDRRTVNAYVYRVFSRASRHTSPDERRSR